MLLQWCLVLICGSVAVFIFVKYRRRLYDKPGVKCDPDQKAIFDHLQYRFLCGYSSAAFADWLYGPYIYHLYKHYDYDSKLINTLYVSGFFSSMFFGTFVGYLADTYGRKKVCLCYAFLGIVSSICKISSSFGFLFIGHVITGINGSILASVFNVWYMHEHLERHHLPREWLNSTFTTATFLNGILAILAGAVADLGVDFAYGHPIAPFIIIVPVLIMAVVFISKWEENRGENSPNRKSFWTSLNIIFHLKDFKLLLMGAVQSLIEASIYAFVVVWPPLLAGMSVPQGVVFAMLMASLSSGAAALHTFSKATIRVQGLLVALHMATVSFTLLVALHSSHTRPSPVLCLIPALMLEFATGIYFPSLGSLQSVIVPESIRASISNLYRLPMNLLMCGILLWANNDGQQEFFLLFSACTVMAFLACGAGHLLRLSLKNSQTLPKMMQENFEVI